MLRTIQIIALIQGVFLLILLINKRRNYKKLNFFLLLSCIVGLILHCIGDDDFNLFQTDANWFLFHAPLVITLFFLLIKYSNSEKDKFQIKDLAYFIPYVFFVILQFIEDVIDKLPNGLGHMLFILGEAMVGFAMIGYLGYMIYNIIINKKKQWILYFIIPYAIVHILDTIPYYFTGEHDTIPFIESYGIIGLSVLLLYIILFKLVIAPKTILPNAEIVKYKTSSINRFNIEEYKEVFIKLMTEDKLFKNNNLTVNDVAKEIGIPRQHLSEVLNVYMQTSFQEYLNKCRIDEFIAYLNDEKYNNYTIMGIATEVGFKSKSSFNTTFKKLKGMTPSEFKKKLKS
ncbi:helix-turn-helix domain-containing protein [Aquimarina rhabdastrellae]